MAAHLLAREGSVASGLRDHADGRRIGFREYAGGVDQIRRGDAEGTRIPSRQLPLRGKKQIKKASKEASNLDTAMGRLRDASGCVAWICDRFRKRRAKYLLVPHRRERVGLCASLRES